MQPQKISNYNQNYNPQKNCNLKQNLIPKTNPAKGDSVSFGATAPSGGILKGAQKALNSTFKFINNSGFFIEFLIVDTISLIAPRILVGLNRDKDKTGHYNFKAAKEEAGREILSGPSMNLIPMGILWAVSKMKPASKIDREILDGLARHSDEIIKEHSKNPITDKKVFHEKLADRIFDENFKGQLARTQNLTEERYRAIFRKALTNALADNLDNKSTEKAQAKFAGITNRMTNKLKQSPVSEGHLKVGKGSIDGASFIKDMKNYSKDILENIINKKGNLKELVENRGMLKTYTAVAAFLSVGAFLLYLPKLYQQGGLSPAQESARRAEKEHLKAIQNSEGGVK